MKILIVADPIEKLKTASDSTLAMANAAQERNHEVYWTTEPELGLRKSEPIAQAHRYSKFDPGRIPKLGPASSEWVKDFNCVLIRKDPPFDESYLKVCWLLTLVEEQVFMMNRPSLLLRYHEKMIPFEALAQGILSEEDVLPTFISDGAGAREFLTKNQIKKSVRKPFLGFGGNDVSLLKDDQSILPNEIVQPFQDEIAQGDRRVIFLDGEILGHFVRMPAAGSFISNLAQGGTAVAKPIDAIEMRLLKKTGMFLKNAKIHFAGADVIGRKLSEVNITSPTGLRNIEALEGTGIAAEVIKFCEKRTN